MVVCSSLPELNCSQSHRGARCACMLFLNEGEAHLDADGSLLHVRVKKHAAPFLVILTVLPVHK